MLLAKHEIDCDNFQVQISKLKVTKVETDRKIDEYVSKISQLEETIVSLELENRNAVELQFEFDRHQNKAKLRETELLQVLQDKEDELTKLKNQFKVLQAERTEELMQLSHCVVGNGTGTGSEHPQNALATAAAVSANIVCLKCGDLQRVLEENKNVTSEFEKLTVQYRELQLSYEKSVNQVQATQQQLAELERNLEQQLSANECDELRATIVELRQQLEAVKNAYDEVQLERDGRTERCAALNRELELVQQKFEGLETKCASLESNWRKQENELSSIRADYAHLESKYNELQVAYDKLKACETKCAHDCQRLQHENDELQKQIQQLKARIEQMQRELSDGLVTARNTQTSHELSMHAKEKAQIAELQNKCEQFQKENEQLSMDILDRVEENEALAKKYKKLEAELENLQILMLALKQTNAEISKPLNPPENAATLMETCANLEAKLAEAETQQKQWLLEKGDFESQIRCLEAKIAEKTDVTTKLQSTINDLRLESEALQARNESLIETSEQTVMNLREEVLRLSRELLEKSTILETCLENCSCVEYSHKFERSNLSQFNELLQERIMTSKLELSGGVNGSTISEINSEHIKPLPKPWTIKEEAIIENETLNLQMKIESKTEKQSSPTKSNCSGDFTSTHSRRASLGNRTLCPQEIELATSLSQSASSGEIDMQGTQLIKSLQAELKRKEELCAQLQLELLEKINQAENGFRENLRTYNEDWERNRLQYESKIDELEQALALQSKKHATQQDQHDVSLSSSFMASQQQQDHQQHQRQNNCSTPTTPTSPSTSLIEKRKMSAERLQIITECNEQITELSQSVKNLKAANNELSIALSEKTKQLEEQEAFIETTKALQARYELALTRVMADRELFKLESIIDYQAEHLRNAKIQNLTKLSDQLRQTRNELKAQLHIENNANRVENEIFDLLATIKAKANQRNTQIQELEKIDEHLLNERNTIRADVDLLAKFDAKFEPISEEIFKLKLIVENIGEEIDGKMAKLEELCAHLKAQHAKINTETQIKDKISYKECEIADLETKLKEQIAEKEHKIEKLEAIMRKQITELDTMSELREEQLLAREEASKLSKENEKLKKQLNEYKSTLGALEQKAAEFQDDKRHYEMRLDEREAENESITILFSEMKQQNEILQEKLRDLNQKHEAATSALDLEKQKLKSELQASKGACAKAVEELETCMLKSETRAQELHTLQLQAQNLIKTISDYEVLEKELEEVHKSKENLVGELQQLRDKENVNNAAFESLKEQLKVHRAKEQIMQRELIDLQLNLKAEQQKHEREAQELRSQINELALKCENLKATNVALEKAANDLKQKVADLNAAQEVELQQKEQIAKLKTKNQSLTSRLEALETAAMTKSREYEKELKQRLEAYNDMSKQLATKNKDFKEKLSKLENTNICLSDQNKQLSERIEALTEMIKNQKIASAALSVDSANNSLELSNASNSSRRSPASKLLAAANGDDMNAVIQKERKNRRLSQHDENRRQSAKFTPVVNNVATMTVAIEESCECDILRQKLKANEKELFIKKSQVTAFTLELRHHPLKLENANLIKRIQEEQQKYSVMLSKYKGRIEEQTAKICALEDRTKMAASMPAVETTERGTSTARLQCKEIETQTESDLEAALHKLEGKYRDIKKICRSRANEIREYAKESNELKQKLSEKENLFNGNLMCTSNSQVDGGGGGNSSCNATTQQSTLTESRIPNKVFGRLRDVKKDDSK